MADYNTSAIGRFRFDDTALSDAYTKAGQVAASALQNIGQQERIDFKAKQEQERLDREEARQAERDRQAKIIFDQAQEDRAKEVLTKTEANDQAKIGTMGYQEGAGLLGKYAKAATDYADLAYKKVEDKTKNADLALEAYSKAFEEIAPKQWELQQKETKYNNSLIDAARRAHLENVERPVDAAKLTQLLEISDKPVLQKQLESKDELAAQLLAPETTVKGIAKANETFKSIVGAPMSSTFLNVAIANAKNHEFQEKLQNDQQKFTATQNYLTRKENEKEREYNRTAKQTADLNESIQAGNRAVHLAEEYHVTIPPNITEGKAKLDYVGDVLKHRPASSGKGSLLEMFNEYAPGGHDITAGHKTATDAVGKTIYDASGKPVMVTEQMVRDALPMSFDLNNDFYGKGTEKNVNELLKTVRTIYLLKHPK